MANSYFRFKRFTILQKHAGMKVTTDACLLGAIAPVQHAQDILDIGAGTGLLSLMVAQRSTADITAVELNVAAFDECSENFNASIWNKRLHLINADFNIWANHIMRQWDIIICNPPFFTKHLKNVDKNVQLARHTDMLSANNVLKFAGAWLTNTGILCLLSPFFDKDDLIEQCTNSGLSFIHVINLRETSAHNCKRILLFASRNNFNCDLPEKEIIIKNGVTYSNDFIKYLSPYYLNL